MHDDPLAAIAAHCPGLGKMSDCCGMKGDKGRHCGRTLIDVEPKTIALATDELALRVPSSFILLLALCRHARPFWSTLNTRRVGPFFQAGAVARGFERGAHIRRSPPEGPAAPELKLPRARHRRRRGRGEKHTRTEKHTFGRMLRTR